MQVGLGTLDVSGALEELEELALVAVDPRVVPELLVADEEPDALPTTPPGAAIPAVPRGW